MDMSSPFHYMYYYQFIYIIYLLLSVIFAHYV